MKIIAIAILCPEFVSKTIDTQIRKLTPINSSVRIPPAFRFLAFSPSSALGGILILLPSRFAVSFRPRGFVIGKIRLLAARHVPPLIDNDNTWVTTNSRAHTERRDPIYRDRSSAANRTSCITRVCDQTNYFLPISPVIVRGGERALRA